MINLYLKNFFLGLGWIGLALLFTVWIYVTVRVVVYGYYRSKFLATRRNEEDDGEETCEEG